MGLITVPLMFFSYIKSSIKLSIYGDYALVELFLITFLNLAICYLHFTFQKDVKSIEVEGTGNLSTDESEEPALEDEIEIPDSFRREYNFLRENAKSLTTLFENYIQRRVSHDTLLRQFQASQESTFLQMRSRVRSDLDIRASDTAKELLQRDKSKTKLIIEDEHSDSNEPETSDGNGSSQVFASGDMHTKLARISNPAAS